MESFANTPQGKAQSKRMIECRIALGCTSAKDFYLQYSYHKGSDGKDLFSYPQYQKYESGERLLGRKAAIQFAGIFKKDWEWLQNGNNQDDEVFILTEEEKEIIKALRAAKEVTAKNNEVQSTSKAG